jgi:cytochrome P450
MYARRDRFDPADELGRLRAETPLTKIEVGSGAATRSVWLATGYDEVRRILGDAVRFSTRRRFGPRPPELAGNLMDYDPPEHTRLRRMLTPEFTMRRMRRLEPRIAGIVAGRLDAMERAGPSADLVELFAGPVPMAVLCELLGVPRDDRGEFVRLAARQVDHGQPPQRRAAAGAAVSHYLEHLVAHQRKDPDDGFIGMLVREHGADCTDGELRGVCGLLLLAGIDNVSGMLALGAMALAGDPDRLGLLRADPDRAVEELLRYLSVVHAPTPRIAREDVPVGDQVIKSGEHVLCSLPAANRDAALAAEPDRLDLAREPGGHVAFGHGVHHCIGAALARIQLRIAYLGLFDRFPALRLAIPDGDVPFRTHTPAYGVTRLPVTW